MECKTQNIKCVTRAINQSWEEIRGCECGMSCVYLSELRSAGSFK